MSENRVFATTLAKVHPRYLRKAERKGRTKEDVDRIVRWLTGCDEAGLQERLDREVDVETFFAETPRMHPNRALMQGVVCGVCVEELEDPLMREIRTLDERIGELARGKAMEPILRK